MYPIKRIQTAIARRIPRPTSGYGALRNRWKELHRFVPGDEPTIVDGGANRGQTTDAFLRMYARPRIHAFEPIPDLADYMRERYRENGLVKVHAAALGADSGTIMFHHNVGSGTSSVLDPSAFAIERHGERVSSVQDIRVPVVRLDDVVDGPVDILKMDLQGYELEALKGSTNLLPRTRVILTEVEFIPLYDGQPLFGDVDIFLRDHGFSLFNLYDLWTTDNGQLTAGDALYIRT